MTPEDEEFMEVQQAHQQERDRIGILEWERRYFTKIFHFQVHKTDEVGGGGDHLEVSVRHLSTIATGSGEENMGGDMAFSGLHTWGCAVALSQYVLSKPQLFAEKRVVELGAGTGLPSLVAASLASECIATDRNAELLQNVMYNAHLNSDTLKGGHTRLQTQVLCWETPASWPKELLGGVDVILGAELLHEIRAMSHLASTVGALLRPLDAS